MSEQPEIPLADISHIRRRLLDIPYAGLSPAQKLDIYWPDEGSGPFPVILSIHGGAFRFGDKRDRQLTPMLAGLRRGYAVVGLNYRMSAEALFPALVQDVKAAVRWVRAHALEHHFNPQKIAAWGGSAGGYLASMAGVSSGIAALQDLDLGSPDQPDHVQAVVDWFGPTDFLKMDAQLAEYGFAPAPDQARNGADSPESLLLGAQITTIPALVQAANPETYIRPNAPPFLVQHGTHDDIVPCLQSVRFAEKLALALGPEKVSLDLLEGARHADPRFEDPENVSRVLNFLDHYLM
jgi:acetyl esterase/lipase